MSMCEPIWRAVALTVMFALVGGAVAHAEAPIVGGSVPSVLSLSLSQPSGFSRVARARAKRRAGGERIYTATVELTVTATDIPTRLSVADGEATGGRRLGHLVRAGRILSSPLEVAAGSSRYRLLDSRVDPQLGEWSEPLANQMATIRLRQAYRGGERALAPYHKLLLVTVTAGGP